MLICENSCFGRIDRERLTVFLVGVMSPEQDVCVGNVPGVLCPIRGPLAVGTSVGGIALVLASFSPLSGSKCDPGVQLQTADK